MSSVERKYSINLRKPINRPQKSALLAEFFGIMLGDGGVSAYQIMITLNRFDDAEYILFVSNVVDTLFDIKPKVRMYSENSITKSVGRIEISRRDLVEFLTQNGLVLGNKVRQQATVPKWILENKEYRIACLRGLIDTDGCVYKNTYIVSGKMYTYKKLLFQIDRYHY